MDAAGVAGWFFSLLTGSILLAWLYNESRGSILVVALFHAAVDVVFTSVIASSPVVTAAGALITVWGIVVLIVVGPRWLSRRGKVIRLFGNAAVTGFIRYDGHVPQSAAQRQS